jgi:hypothetical protein
MKKGGKIEDARMPGQLRMRNMNFKRFHYRRWLDNNFREPQ